MQGSTGRSCFDSPADCNALVSTYFINRESRVARLVKRPKRIDEAAFPCRVREARSLEAVKDSSGERRRKGESCF